MRGDLYGQSEYAVRFDWGPTAAATATADVAVIVDVLSFSTSVCIACERGTAVYPCEWKGVQAREFAQHHAATLAVGRLEAGAEGPVDAPTLSPARMLECAPVERLILPSPNGSTIAASLAVTGATVAVGGLRTATAVARWISSHLQSGRAVAIIAAGERWADDSLRPALEDLLGAGAILSSLAAFGHEASMSPESVAARDAFEGARHVLTQRLQDCVSGRELVAQGFQADVTVASQLDVSECVPVLSTGCFRASP